MNITARTRGWLAAAIASCCAVLLPGMAQAATAAPARPAPRVTVPGCETPGLVIWLDTNSQGAAGSAFYNLEFTNLSGHTCTLDGFPFVTAESLTGHQLAARAAFNHSTTPHNVTVHQGQTVNAVLQIVDVRIVSKRQCKPVTAAGLRVFPPNQTRAKFVPFPFGACSARGVVSMGVHPVTK